MRLRRTQLFRRNVNSRERIDSICGVAERSVEPRGHPPEDELERDEDGRPGDERR